MDLKDSNTVGPANAGIPAASTPDNNVSSVDSDTKVVYTPPSSTTSTSSNSTAAMDLVKSANISIRTYIYFLPYPLPPGTPVPYTTGLPTNNPLNLPTTLFEPTSTVVLTSPNNTFVDLRFLKPLSPSPSATPSDVLDWGFAGLSASRSIREGVSHSTWTHFVDSRFPAGASMPIDEGDMYAISDTLTLEHGHAFHPHLKAVKSHEEMWEDEDTLSTNTTSKLCTVLRLQDDENGFRGVVVRLGQYVQGIVVMGNEVTAERWEHAAENGWKRTKRVGRQMLPCAILTREQVLSVGGRVRYGEFEWVVEEVWEW